MATGDNLLFGKLMDKTGDPIGGVNVKLQPLDRSAAPIVVQSDSEGQFTFTQLENQTTRDKYINQPSRSVLIAEDGEWFFSQSGNLENVLGTAQDLSLNTQILFGPAVASNESGEFEPSLITCYRDVHSPGRQDLFLEVVDLYSASDASDTPDRYNILEGARANQLQSGTFLLSHLRNKARLNFGPQTEISDDIIAPVQVLAMPATEENLELESWHPVQTGRPLGGVGSGYIRVSTTHQTLSDGRDKVSEGVGMITGGILGATPVLSSILSVADAVEYAVGHQFDVEASVGDHSSGFPNPEQQDDLTELPDPNTHVTTPLGWNLNRAEFSDANAGAVLMKVPIKFDENTDNLRMTTHAEWKHDYEHVTFKKILQLDRVGGDSGIPEDLPTGISDNHYSAVAGDDEELNQTELSQGVDEWLSSEDNEINGTEFSQTQIRKLANYWFRNK
jgi:hypothetical protein